MRKTFWLAPLGALILAGAACKDANNAKDEPKITSQQEPGSTTAQAPSRLEPGSKREDTSAALKNETGQARSDQTSGEGAVAATGSPTQDKGAPMNAGNTMAQGAQAGAAGTQTIVAIVSKASDDSIELQSGQKLAIDSSTSVRIDGSEGRGGQIKEGSEARASYRDVGGKPVALRIDVVTAPASAPASEQKTEPLKAEPQK